MLTPSVTSDIHVAVFLSRATSIAHWAEHGIVDREAALYRQMRGHLATVRLVTSGGVEDLRYQPTLGTCEILPNRWRLPANLYSMLAPLLHRRRLRDVTVIRSHQLDGAWTAAIASRVYAKPLIVRAGYPWAEFFARERGRGVKARLAALLQALSLRQAARVIVTTEEMKRTLLQRYGISPEAVHVIPNWVDTDRFRPCPEVTPIEGRLCYIGRLHPRKNVIALLETVTQIPGTSLTVVGEGTERSRLVAFAARHRIDVRFLGTVPHERLPDEIARAQVFVLPSRFEGHPKALLEAMACGAAVVGTDVEGTRSLIRHEETGLLCPDDVGGLTQAVRRLLGDAPLRRRLGTAARAAVEREFGLDRVVQQELRLIDGLRQRRTAS